MYGHVIVFIMFFYFKPINNEVNLNIDIQLEGR